MPVHRWLGVTVEERQGSFVRAGRCGIGVLAPVGECS
jgi:hypothetical protein